MTDFASLFAIPRIIMRACRHMIRPAPRCRFVLEDADGTSILKAFSESTGVELGRLTYSSLKMTSTTYIWDIDVLPRWRRRGVGMALLQHAGSISPYPDFGLVTVVPESILFWRSVVLSRTLKKTMRVRMGLTYTEVDLLTRYQKSFERPPYVGMPATNVDHAR